MKSPGLEDDYRELELKPGASLEQVRRSYRELALLWHPDRRNGGQQRGSGAHHKMTRINLAYERLREALERRSDSTSHSERPPRGKSPEQTQHRQASERGNTPGRHSHEKRTNTLGMRFVSVDGTSVFFSIWETRVQDYRAYAESTRGVDVSWQNPGFAQTPTHPAVKVSWEDATRFCAWLTEKEQREGKLPMAGHYRLPTDEEWSWAVGIGNRERNGTPKEKGKRLKAQYPWGTSWPPPKGAGNYDPSLGIDSYDFTSPVGSFAANAQGLFDLGGNVWEWCEDFLEGSPRPNRSGADAGPAAARVLRGGSWNFSGPDHLLSSYRNGAAQNARSHGIGFRIVLALG